MEEITTVATLLRNDNYVTTLILTDVCEDFFDKSGAQIGHYLPNKKSYNVAILRMTQEEKPQHT